MSSKRNKSFTIRFTEKELKYLQDQSEALNIPISVLIRMIIAKHKGANENEL